MSFIKAGFVAAAVLGLAAAASAAPVNGTGLVTPDVIFGSGNANGSFTGTTANNIEVALRAKQRYPAANVFNYDGISTYTFDSTVLTTNPANRSVFNFEWAINVDVTGAVGDTLSQFDFALSFDTDPTAGIAYSSFDPFTVPTYFDHSLGNGLTGNGAGIESPDFPTLLANMGLYSVAQQSSNLGFGFSADPDLPGIYSFALSVLADGTTDVLASTEITVRVEPVPAPVPLPAGLPLLLAGAGVLLLVRRRGTSRI